MDSSGLYEKYHVERTDGKPVGRCFVLEPETDYAARKALETYAYHCPGKLGQEIRGWLTEIDAKLQAEIKARNQRWQEWAEQLAVNPVCPVCGAQAHKVAYADDGWYLGWECDSGSGCLEDVEIPWPFGDEEKSDAELQALGYEIV